MSVAVASSGRSSARGRQPKRSRRDTASVRFAGSCRLARTHANRTGLPAHLCWRRRPRADSSHSLRAGLHRFRIREPARFRCLYDVRTDAAGIPAPVRLRVRSRHRREGSCEIDVAGDAWLPRLRAGRRRPYRSSRHARFAELHAGSDARSERSRHAGGWSPLSRRASQAIAPAISISASTPPVCAASTT